MNLPFFHLRYSFEKITVSQKKNVSDTFNMEPTFYYIKK